MRWHFSSVFCAISICATAASANGPEASLKRSAPTRSTWNTVAEAVNNKDCSQFGEGEEAHSYGQGTLVHFTEIVPPAHTPVKRERPNGYKGVMLLADGKEAEFRVSSMWKDPEAPVAELCQAPPPIRMWPGQTYGFCYRPIVSRSVEYLWIPRFDAIVPIEITLPLPTLKKENAND